MTIMDSVRLLRLHAFELLLTVGLVYLPMIIATKSGVGVIIAVAVIFGILRLINKKLNYRIQMTDQCILITGCDTGFGHALAKQLDSIGLRVYACCLNEKGDGADALRAQCTVKLKVIQLDVTNEASVINCVEAVSNECRDKGLWALVNNAGILYPGAVEFTAVDMYKEIAEVNLFGAIRTTKAFLPLIRKAKGRIINVSSVDGRFPRPLKSAYCVTKYGLECFSDALRMEMIAFGVKVVVIEPGHFGGGTGILDLKRVSVLTEYLEKTWKDAPDNIKAEYGRDTMNKLIASLRPSSLSANRNLRLVTDVMEDAVLCKNPRTRYEIGGGKGFYDYLRVLIQAKHWLPDTWSDRLINRECNSFIH